MSPMTPYTPILQATGWSLREWSRRSGLSINTLRKLSAGNKGKPVVAQARTIAKLAATLRNSADDFNALADTLESP